MKKHFKKGDILRRKDNLSSYHYQLVRFMEFKTFYDATGEVWTYRLTRPCPICDSRLYTGLFLYSSFKKVKK